MSYAAPYPALATPPSAPAQPSGGLGAASVPKILLGLGATCLLVAAVIFLAVAWSWLGVGGRTAVLVALTVTTALSGQWLARRDLGVAAEALTTVALGLVMVDLFGAATAGWLGSPSDQWFVVMVGTSLLAVSLGLCVPARRLFAPQVAAPLGLGHRDGSAPGRTGTTSWSRRRPCSASRASPWAAARLARWCSPGPPLPAPGWRSSA